MLLTIDKRPCFRKRGKSLYFFLSYIGWLTYPYPQERIKSVWFTTYLRNSDTQTHIYLGGLFTDNLSLCINSAFIDERSEKYQAWFFPESSHKYIVLFSNSLSVRWCVLMDDKSSNNVDIITTVKHAVWLVNSRAGSGYPARGIKMPSRDFRGILKMSLFHCSYFIKQLPNGFPSRKAWSMHLGCCSFFGKRKNTRKNTLACGSSIFTLSESLATSLVHGSRIPARKTIRYSYIPR
jgi:hypothetical protein